MKVIFLDVDGVLNSSRFTRQRLKSKEWSDVDPKAMQRILRVVKRTDAQIVLSSSWRKNPDNINYLYTQGLPVIYDKTPSLESGHRGREIATWLQGRYDIDKFIILDDELDAGELHPKHFIKTDWESGMLSKHERMAIYLLIYGVEPIPGVKRP